VSRPQNCGFSRIQRADNRRKSPARRNRFQDSTTRVHYEGLNCLAHEIVSGMIPSHRAARELIAFYLDSGADALIGDTPVDRMAETPAVANARPPGLDARVGEKSARAVRPDPRAFAQSQAPPSPSPPASPEAAIMAARAAARDAKTLDELRMLLTAFEGCTLRTTATQLVFADGNPQGRVMFVGEAPGYDEDIIGRPFVGRSGKLLHRQRGAVAAARQSHTDAAGNRDLPAVHPPPDRACRSGHFGLPRRACHANAARD
jgi:hypothetical protein